jgi:Sulfotransferase family
MNSGDQIVIFLHIPKTGGTTLHHILERCYPKDQICNFKSPNHRSEIEKFKRLAPGKREAYRLIKGHLSFGLHRHVPGRSTYITFLREPLARALSFYYYAKGHPEHYLYPLLRDDHTDLKKLLRQHTATGRELFNLQTSMIAGDQWADPERPADRAALERAKQNLRSHFQVVGLTEEFDLSLRLLSRAFGWKVRFYTKKNVTRGKGRIETLDAETGRLLRKANALDLELYQFAREFFDTERRNGEHHHLVRTSPTSGLGSYLKRVSNLMRRNRSIATNPAAPAYPVSDRRPQGGQLPQSAGGRTGE